MPAEVFNNVQYVACYKKNDACKIVSHKKTDTHNYETKESLVDKPITIIAGTSTTYDGAAYDPNNSILNATFIFTFKNENGKCMTTDWYKEDRKLILCADNNDDYNKLTNHYMNNILKTMRYGKKYGIFYFLR